MDSNSTNFNYNTLCRLCLCEDDSLIPIFDDNYTFLPYKIAACVNVEVHETDKTSTMICKLCLAKIEEWYAFRINCEDSQSKLQNLVFNIASDNATFMGISIKEEILSDDDAAIFGNELIDASICIKSEPSDEIFPAESEDEELENLHLTPFSPSALETSTIEPDSLLVPTLECPADVHGINDQFYSEVHELKRSQSRMGEISSVCRLCNKSFSNGYNRLRHERNVHNIDRMVTSVQSESTTPPELVDVAPDLPRDVSVEQFAANLQLAQTDTQNPTTESEFLEYNRKMQKMKETLICDCCNSQYSSYYKLRYHCKIPEIDRYACFLCCIAFPNRSQYMRHAFKKYCKQRARMIQEKDRLFKVYQHFLCSVCDVLFVHKMFLTRHILEEHFSPKKYTGKCLRCEQSFEHIYDYKEHVQGPCSYKIYCSICRVAYDTLDDFNNHTYVHKDKSNADLDQTTDQDDRNAQNGNSQKVETHKRPVKIKFPKRVKTQKKKMSMDVVCPCCSKRYSSRCGLMRHLIVAHKTFQFFKCSICDHNYNFIFKEDLFKHVQKYHKSTEDSDMEYNNYSCGQCGTLFPSLDLWCEHQQSHDTKSVHTCNECNRVFGSESELDQHKSSHSNLKLKLLRCTKSNSYKAIADFNFLSESPPAFSCQGCDKIFDTTEELKKHAVIHEKGPSPDSPNSENMYKCSYCPKQYSLRGSLHKHKRKKHVLRYKVVPKVPVHFPVRINCNLCKKVYGTKKALWAHKRKHHQSDKSVKNKNKIENETPVLQSKETEEISQDESYECRICPKLFPTARGLHVHETMKHVTKAFSCPVCNVGFDKTDILLEHLKTHVIKNNDDKFAKCPCCGKMCVAGTGIGLHLRMHVLSNELKNIEPKPEKPPALNNESQNPLQCLYCPKICVNFSGLSTHIKFLHPKFFSIHKKNKVVKTYPRFPCKLCKRNFISDSLLKRHLKTHVKTGTGKLYKCTSNGCTVSFSNYNSFYSHIKTHKKSYCLECKKDFQSESALNSHKGWHRRQIKPPTKDLKCTDCNQSFDTSEEYLEHAKLHSKVLKCKFCTKTFFYTQALKRHLAFVHVNETIKNKMIIKKSVAAKKNKKLKKKMMENLDLSPSQADLMYKCIECNTSFLNAKQLRLHMRKIHPDKI